MSETTWWLRTQDETFGPEPESRLVEWARMGRIQPGQEVSSDEIVWRRVEEVPFLDMRFSIDIGDGNPRGPFNKAAAEALLASGRLPPTASSRSRAFKTGTATPWWSTIKAAAKRGTLISRRSSCARATPSPARRSAPSRINKRSTRSRS